jgi:GNAT superfamily N-acetyltransferase
VNGIRPARAEDVAVVRAIVMAAYQPYVTRLGQRPGPMDDDYARRVAAGQVWVLERTDLVTAILVLEATSERFLLDNIAVAPEYHGTGIGRTLLMFAEQEAMRQNRSEIHLYTNALMAENIALYQRIGYVVTTRVHEKGFDRVYMKKSLLSR